jgi:predicted flap endonuclease-1-like 5' DNA nuclease
MELTSLFGYILIGLLFGWITSTLVEWVWYRGRRRRIELAMASPGARGSYQVGERAAPTVAGDTTAPRRRSQEDARPQAAEGKRARAKRRKGQPLANRPDNLTAIHGIGDLYEQLLYRVGIFTWHQLSRVDAESLQQITSALPSSNTHAWIDQARKLAKGNDRVGAVYDGPLPADLTRIDGVDHLYEDELYAAGIFTFRQFAETAPDELARIIPAHQAGDHLDFVSWIAQADSLRDEYYADEPPIL